MREQVQRVLTAAFFFGFFKLLLFYKVPILKLA